MSEYPEKSKIELQRVGDRPDPGRHQAASAMAGLRGRENRSWRWAANAVGNQYLFGQTDGEDGQPNCKRPSGGPIGCCKRELRDYFRMVQDRTSNQMRKISREKQIVNEAVLPRRSPVAIDDKGDLRKRKKGNADRKHDSQQFDVRMRQSHSLRKEIGVFIKTK